MMTRNAGQPLARPTLTCALRVLETCHPPTIYMPPAEVRVEVLPPSDARSAWCEFKGCGRYVDAIVHGRRVKTVGWSDRDPSPGYQELRDHVAVYPGRVDGAWIDDERVRAQQGGFYGGWITGTVVRCSCSTTCGSRRVHGLLTAYLGQPDFRGDNDLLRERLVACV